MADNLIPNVRPVDLDTARPLGRTSHPPSPQAAAVRQQLTSGAVAMQSESGSKDRAEVKPERRFSNPLVDVMLKFKVDAKTNDVTIMMVDRVTRKVVRTIPPEEMSTMDPGELLELFT